MADGTTPTPPAAPFPGENAVTIGNGRMGIDLTRQGITRVVDRISGWTAFAADADTARWFHLTVPTPLWSSRSVTSAAAGRCEWREETAGQVLRFADFTVAGQALDLRVEVALRAPAGSDEVLLALRLENRSGTPVTGACFPWLVGWQSPGDPGRDQILLGPGVQPIRSAALASAWRIAWANGFGEEQAADYPVYSHIPWMDLSGDRGGVSCINYQRRPWQCYAALKNLAGFAPEAAIPSVFWGFYAYCLPGCTWTSPEIGISVHDGDWHQTADRYRAWAEGALAPAAANRALRESIGSLHVWFRGFDGTPHNAIADLPRVAADARRYGVRELCVWDRMTMGVYGSAYEPQEDLLGYPPEEKAELTAAVRQAVAGGSDVSALINFRLMNPLRTVFQAENLADHMQEVLAGTRKLETWVAAGIPGKFFPTSHLGPGCHVFSPFSETYRQRVLRQIEAYLEFGYTSLFYDQPFETVPDYSRKDRGAAPEATYEATVDLIGSVRERLLRRHPEATIMGEQCDVFAAAVIDQWMTWAWSDHPSGLETLRRMHYALPGTVFNCVISVDSGAPTARFGLICQAFAMGLHLFLAVDALTGTLADVPELGDYVLKLAGLRRRCAARTVHGRFRDTAGFSIQTSDGLVACSYDSPGGPAVIVAAPTQAGVAEIALRREAFSHPGTPGNGLVVGLDLAEAPVRGDVLSVQLGENGVLVWLP